jgi:hypothetical protein
MTRLQKEEAEGLKKQQEQAKQQTEKAKKTDDADSDDKSKKNVERGKTETPNIHNLM